MAHNHWHLWNKYFSETNINIPLNLTIIEINIPNVKHQCQVQLCFPHWCHHQGWPTPLSLSFSLSLEVYGFLTLLVVAIRFKDIWAMAFWRIRFNASQNYRLCFELSFFFSLIKVWSLLYTRLNEFFLLWTKCSRIIKVGKE